MKYLSIWCLITLFAFFSNTQAATFYVGDSTQCNQANHYDNLHLALLAANSNGSQADEIRLTNTVSYQGDTNGSYSIALSNAGHITIAGGYGNCGDPVNTTPPNIGNTADAVFEVKNNALVSLKNLKILGSDSRGIIVNENAALYLESVDVSDNVAGIRVLGGAYVELDENTTVFNNGHLDDIPKGGGIWCFGNNSEVTIAGKLGKK
ncbi:right-handed parallel beta-helix repeat-containing protein [Marinicella rhabdoformis]|uniref:right-handed parallel beta-helix repeat-containing protein n=1 Tax=Marinicella rhabdoformis TaxID=2580566 RepID=UPI0012AEC835|nr:right-handed parallel beta-helix repeat-containing protein [Marinicella rhabdoformis]